MRIRHHQNDDFGLSRELTGIRTPLSAAGANLKRVHILKSIRTDKRTSRQFLLAEDLAELEKACNKVGDVALVTLDPIAATAARATTSRSRAPASA